MSIASAINAGIRVAKAKMGDLVEQGTYRMYTGRTYENGVYTDQYNDVPVDFAPDRFSYQETMDADYELSDVKVLVFNTDNAVYVTNVKDVFVMDGVEYKVKKIDPAKVGNFKPVITLIMRR